MRHQKILRMMLPWIVGIASAPGCQHSASQAPRDTLFGANSERTAKLNDHQIADLQIAHGRVLEKQGDLSNAAEAYFRALKVDANRGDAYLRLAVLHDQAGKFKESQEFYQKALALMPGNTDIFCDMGYSLYLQQRWPEAEMNLRQALAIAPDHLKAHNNLGLVLAHEGREEEALTEFHRAGCSPAEMHVNLAFVLTLERKWSDAQGHYLLAKSLDASSQAAQKGLEEVNSLISGNSGRSQIQQAGWTPATATAGR